jgi:hypothetical protein
MMQDDVPGAIEPLRIAYRNSVDVKTIYGIASCLEGVALMAALLGDHQLSARMIGVARPINTSIGLTPTPKDQAVVDRAESLDRAKLGDGEFERLLHMGMAEDVGDAVREAEEFLAKAAEANEPKETGPRPGGLSRQEVEVLRLVASGYTNREIASTLVLSVRTVENHIANACGKDQLARPSRSDRVGDRTWAPSRPTVVSRAPSEAAVRFADGKALPPPILFAMAAERNSLAHPFLLQGRAVHRAGGRTCPGSSANERIATCHVRWPWRMGKTRLAIEAARAWIDAHPADVWFVDLSSASDAAGIERAGPHSHSACVTTVSTPLAEQVATYLKAGAGLIVLDNCEQVIEAAAGFTEYLLSATQMCECWRRAGSRWGLPRRRCSRFRAWVWRTTRSRCSKIARGL